MKEIYKQYENTNYFISNFGNLKNKRNKVLKCDHANVRYKQTSLYINKKPKKFLIHRLVAKVFVPNPKNLKIVNHIDGNKKNNHAKNLEWCTQKHNIRHAWSIGLTTSKVGENKHSSVLDDMHILTIATLKDGYNRNKLAKYLPVKNNQKATLKSKREQIRRIIKGERWNHLNYLFN
jgi:hypothetical protein